MLALEEMLIRLGVAIVLGAIVGLERELIGKEAGVRTNILIASGAALFAIIAVNLPAVIGTSLENVTDIRANNAGFLMVLANVAVGAGFLGAGIIIKQGTHVRGLTTAASIWFVAAVGILAGIGLLRFSAITTVGLTVITVILRKVEYKWLGKEERIKESQENNN